MSQDDNKNDVFSPILIDFVSLNNPRPDESEQKYEITETAARLSNQLVKAYPRLVNNEKSIITCLETLIEELGRVHHIPEIRIIILQSLGYQPLVNMVKSLTNIVSTLKKSHKESEEIMEVIKDVANGHKIHLH